MLTIESGSCEEVERYVQRFPEIGDVSLGCGPQHPVSPVHSLQQELKQVLTLYPRLAEQKGYLCFLQRYAACHIESNSELFLDIFGLEANVSDSLLYPDESYLRTDELLPFASVVIAKHTLVDAEVVFAWKFTDQSTAIFSQDMFLEGALDAKCYVPYVDSFTDWLKVLTETGGTFGFV
jgi:hypothetical protein